MNDATGLCRGCFRTLDEIARWSQMSDRERTGVLDALPVRRTESEPPVSAGERS